MAETLLCVMLGAAALYAVLGGADFGVGIIEPLLGPRRERDIEHAILPVWEANHVWLVLLVVLAFVGFPGLFERVATFLHIPLLLALLGIVARGSAFTFRHYDPAPGALRSWYSWAFRLGSLLAPLFLGVCVAACVQGRLEDDLSLAPYALFVAPWNTLFCWATGLFACAMFAFQGAALLAAERPQREGGPLPLAKLARRLHALAIGCGGLVLASAYRAGVPWFRGFWTRPSGWGSLLAATLLIPVVAYAFQRGRPWLLRLAVGAQLSSVLLGLFGAQYPVLLQLHGGVLTVAEAAAPAATLRALVWAVGLGLLLIAPALGYLLRVYKLSSR